MCEPQPYQVLPSGVVSDELGEMGGIFFPLWMGLMAGAAGYAVAHFDLGVGVGLEGWRMETDGLMAGLRGGVELLGCGIWQAKCRWSPDLLCEADSNDE